MEHPSLAEALGATFPTMRNQMAKTPGALSADQHKLVKTSLTVAHPASYPAKSREHPDNETRWLQTGLGI
jgi:hypothetical protein